MGSLHHGVIDRDLRRLGKGLAIENDEAEILVRQRNGLTCRRGDLRLETRELLQHHVGAKHEIARVPQISRGGRRAAYGRVFSRRWLTIRTTNT